MNLVLSREQRERHESKLNMASRIITASGGSVPETIGRNIYEFGHNNDPSQIFDLRLMQSNDGLELDTSAELLH